MAVDVEVDVELLKSEIRKTYASVSAEPEKDFIFPTGRAWAEDLGYPEELANVPEPAVESFAGVANPWVMGRLGGLAVPGAALRTQHHRKRVRRRGRCSRFRATVDPFRFVRPATSE